MKSVFIRLTIGLLLAGTACAQNQIAPVQQPEVPPKQNQGDSVQQRARERELKAVWEQHKNDFDYRLGDWEFKARELQGGTYGGFWSAVRLESGQVLDQFRVTGPNGETWAPTTSLRGYSAARRRWELVSTRESNGLLDFGTAEKVGDEMHIEQTFGVSSPKPQRWRIRYHDISVNRFLWSGDCSNDDGKTWQKDCVTIEAHRIGPARTLAPIAPSVRQAPASAQ